MTKIKTLADRGLIYCDITDYEQYTMTELIDEFCEIIPAFFNSYKHLMQLYSKNRDLTDHMMLQLRADLLSPPTARTSHFVARIIHSYFINYHEY